MTTMIIIRGFDSLLRTKIADRYQKIHGTIPIHSLVEGLGNVERLLTLSKNLIVTGPLSSQEEMDYLDRAASETLSTVLVYRIPGDGDMADYPGEAILDEFAIKELLGE